jgi:hypothetical protein
VARPELQTWRPRHAIIHTFQHIELIFNSEGAETAYWVGPRIKERKLIKLIMRAKAHPSVYNITFKVFIFRTECIPNTSGKHHIANKGL